MSIERLAALCALLLAGCAATPKGDHSNDGQLASAHAQETGKSEKVCTREKPLGSNLPRVVCYSRQQLNQQALQTPDPSLRRGHPSTNNTAQRLRPSGPPRKPNG